MGVLGLSDASRRTALASSVRLVELEGGEGGEGRRVREGRGVREGNNFDTGDRNYHVKLRVRQAICCEILSEIPRQNSIFC